MSTINYSIARENMVTQQLRTWDVFDPRVLDLFATLPREMYLPERFKHLAYSDTPLPLDNGHVLQPPREQARMLQALALKPSDKVLEIGRGRDFITKCLSELTGSVLSVDLQSALDLQDTFDVICMHGSVKKLPEKLQSMLTLGGRLFAIIVEEPAMFATLITRINQSDWRTQVLFETVAPRLEQGEPKPQFEF